MWQLHLSAVMEKCWGLTGVVHLSFSGRGEGKNQKNGGDDSTGLSLLPSIFCQLLKTSEHKAVRAPKEETLRIRGRPWVCNRSEKKTLPPPIKATMMPVAAISFDLRIMAPQTIRIAAPRLIRMDLLQARLDGSKPKRAERLVSASEAKK